MNGNDSDWLNDTLPTNKENSTQNDINKNSNLENNSEIKNNTNDEENTNNNSNEKPQPKTLASAVQDIKIEQSDEENYLEEYMGKNYEKISTRLLNFGALFFSYLYLFYRKMYLLGLIILLIQTALTMYVNPYISLITNIILFLSANIIYTGHAKRKIEKIKNKSGSKLKENLVNECSAKGGTSKKGVFFAIVLGLIATIFISFQVRDKDPYKQIADFFDDKFEYVKQETDSLTK